MCEVECTNIKTEPVCCVFFLDNSVHDLNGTHIVVIFHDTKIIRYQNVSITDFVGLMELVVTVGPTNCYQQENTNHHLKAACPSCVKALKGKIITVHRLAYPKLIQTYL